MERNGIILFGIFLIFAVVSGFNHKAFQIPQNLEHGTYEIDSVTGDLLPVKGKECTKPGYMCEDCKNVSICIPIAGGFIKEDADVCPTGQTCFEATGLCTSGPNPDCDDNFLNYKFICHQIGMFPDPLNCMRHHICIPDKNGQVEPTPITMKCDGNYYYNARTTLCNKKITNNTCPVLSNPCKNGTQSGAIVGNPQMYYVCLLINGTYFPQMFLCPNNEEFSIGTGFCADSSPELAAGSDGKCTKKGFFYDPASCFNSYECTGPGVAPILRPCTAKMRFDHKIQQCVDFKCSDLAY